MRAGLVGAVAVTALLAVFALDRNMTILLMAAFGAFMGVTAAFGGSLGFAWAGAIVGQGTKASYQSALWICVAIGIAAFATSLILKPRSAPVEPAYSGLTH